jgi:hypothetical protein
MLYILTYLNLYFLILSYQIKKRLYRVVPILRHSNQKWALTLAKSA